MITALDSGVYWTEYDQSSPPIENSERIGTGTESDRSEYFQGMWTLIWRFREFMLTGCA